MARPLRLEAPHTFYHVLSRGNEKRETFLSRRDYEHFLELLWDSCARFRVILYSYCLMNNHFHLLLQTLEPNLAEFMKRLLGLYTMAFNRRHSRVGHLFQGRYKSFVVSQENYLLELSRYIHLNPCRAGLAKLPEEYPWSSLVFFLSEKPPKFLDPSPILSQFEDARAYRDFVMEKIVVEEDPFKGAIGGVFLGSEDFVERFKAKIARQRSRVKEISRERELLRVNPEKVEALLAKEGEAFKIYGLWKWARMRQSEIGEKLGKTRSAICHSIQRFEDRIVRDSGLREKLEGRGKELGSEEFSTFND